MNFWTTSDGSDVGNSNTYENSNDLAPIPDKTSVLFAVEEAKWDTTQQGERFISTKWRVAAPQPYGNRVVFHKLRVYSNDDKKADKAKRMLAAIDANAGGKLRQLNHEPTDQDLMLALVGKPMGGKLGVWETEDKSASGNWIMAVSPATRGGAQQQPAQQQRQPVQQQTAAYASLDDPDQIPF